jgi:hypothetical protein
VLGVAAVLGAVPLGVIAYIAGTGGFENSAYSTGAVAFFGGATTACVLATGVFALGYAWTGERRLVRPHLAAWVVGAVVFFSLWLLTGFWT